MTRSTRRKRQPKPLALIATSALVVLLAGAVDFAENLQRLRSYSPARRQELLRNLERFESLPPGEQQALRRLDEQIAQLDPETRLRYLGVLRSYSLWLKGLTEAQRRELQEIPAERRLARVHELIRSSPPPTFESIDRSLARSAALSSSPLLDQVFWIRTWLALSPQRRAEVERLRPAARPARLERLGDELGIKDDRPDIRRRLENEIQKRQRPGLGKALEAISAKAKAEQVRRFAEARMLQNLAAEPVSDAELRAFLNAIPSWLRESIDPLPPRAARERLTVLYHLVGKASIERTAKSAPPATTPTTTPKRAAPPRPGAAPL